MALIASENFIQINNNTIEVTRDVHKSGYLLYLNYVKGDEEKVELSTICFMDNDNSTQYFLTETESDGKIIKWYRYLNSSIIAIYPFRLPGRCKKFRIVSNFVNSTVEGSLTVGCKANTFYEK